MLIGWIKRRLKADNLAKADADALIFAKGQTAYAEACRRERVSLFKNREAQDGCRDRVHWRRVASIIAASAAA